MNVFLKLILVICLFLIDSQIDAQENDFKNAQTLFYYQDKDSGEMIELKPEKSWTRFRMSMFSYATKMYFVVAKSESPYIFSSRSMPNLYVRFDPGNDTPSKNIVMIKGDIVRKDREFLKFRMGPFFKIKDISSIYIKLKFEKIDENTYRILLPRSALMSGEYAIYDLSKLPEKESDSDELMINCFSIR